MNKLIKAFLTCTIIFLAGCNLFPEKSKKPVIYLYPEKTTEVDVKVNLGVRLPQHIQSTMMVGKLWQSQMEHFMY